MRADEEPTPADPVTDTLDPTKTRVQTAPPTVTSTDVLPSVPGYEIRSELARGGMGVVYLARDAAFNRDVAVKVMHPEQDVLRFVVESRVTGRLAHPGVPPAHALGRLADGRPFLVMKLVRGRTLAELLRSDRPNLSAILTLFEPICQTVGFAHSKRIVHRDLKPSNVMIGAFGEVYVMDWGLAKVSARPEPEQAPGAPLAQGVGAAHTVAGQIKGTPAYMAPEQARGEPVDARADVFALGGILAAMLTGRPPFSGDTALDTVLQAALGQVDDCFAAVAACGADPELVALAKRCLAPRAEDRFGDGREVAAAVVAYRRGAEKRLRRAKRERAAAEARAEEAINTRREAEARTAAQRRARRLMTVLFATAAGVLLAAGGVAWLIDHRAANQRNEEARLAGERDAEARLKGDQARAGARAALVLAADLRRQIKFTASGAALDQAAALAEGGAPDLAPEVQQARSDLAVVVALDGIRSRAWVWTSLGNGNGIFDTKFVGPASRAAFAAHGISPDSADPAEAAARLTASAVRAELLAGLDVWALFEFDNAVRDRLLAVARRADPGPWADRFRDPAVRSSKESVARLVADADLFALSPAVLAGLAGLMEAHDLDPVGVLESARASHPADFGLAMALGGRHMRRGEHVAMIGSYDAARALRPDNSTAWVNLGAGRANTGEPDAALAAFRRALELDPANPVTHQNVGIVLQTKGDWVGALAAHRRALELDPKYVYAQNSIGVVLKEQGQHAASLAAYRKALEFDPQFGPAHFNVGVCLDDSGDRAGAIAAYRASIRCDPAFAVAHYNLGLLLNDDGDRAGALAAYRRAIELDPKSVMALNNLGWTLADIDRYAEAVEVLERAVRLDPRHALAHANLAWALGRVGEWDRATAAARRAVEIDPCLPTASYQLGWVFENRGDEDEAIRAYRQALEVDPTHSMALANLGGILSNRGRTAEALPYLRRAVAADPANATARNNLGWTLASTEDRPAGLAELRKAVELDPKLALAHHNIGWVLEQRGDTEGAAAAYGRAVAADPDRTYSHINLALIRLNQERVVEAEASARAAIRSDPKNADARACLGFVLEEKGDLTGALLAATEAARLNPTKWAQRLRYLSGAFVAPPPRLVRP